MKRAAIYCRVSTLDQRNESQLYDLRSMAAQRGLAIVQEYTDQISGSRAKRPGLDDLMRDARHGKFDVLLIWRFDRLARSVRHFLEVLDELQHLKIDFISFSEQVDTSSPLGRAMIVILGAIAQLERDIIRERVRAGMRRARLEGVRLGRRPLDVDRDSILRDRERGVSLSKIAAAHRLSRASVSRLLKDAGVTRPKGVVQAPPQLHENKPPESAA
jgi:DNA invertase Pin-like site-specific DNA recombinase